MPNAEVCDATEGGLCAAAGNPILRSRKFGSKSKIESKKSNAESLAFGQFGALRVYIQFSFVPDIWGFDLR